MSKPVRISFIFNYITIFFNYVFFYDQCVLIIPFYNFLYIISFST